MDKWEYITLTYDYTFPMDENLCLMGAIGWESYAVTTYECDKMTYFKVFFKRKIQQENGNKA